MNDKQEIYCYDFSVGCSRPGCNKRLNKDSIVIINNDYKAMLFELDDEAIKCEAKKLDSESQHTDYTTFKDMKGEKPKAIYFVNRSGNVTQIY